jgi:hypothetical protein
VRKTGDEGIYGVVAPFFAFRAVVVANPVFYPELGSDARRKIFNFTVNLLKSERFEIEKVNDYLGRAGFSPLSSGPDILKETM